ncbi:MAG: methyltransferase [Thermodesulfovibrionales bacterium]
MRSETTLDGLRDVRVYQYVDGYRFSVDALLLYAFVQMKDARTIVDLGAGSGIIGLLLARKYPKADVLLVELQEQLFLLASKSIRHNGLEDRVRAVNADIRGIRQRLEPSSADLVVSNPPYRSAGTGRLSVGDEKAIARHELSVRLEDVVDAAAFVLKGKGRFAMIYLPERLIEVFELLRSRGLEPKRIRFVHNKISSVSKIVLVESVRDGRPGLRVERPLYLYGDNGEYTPEVLEMYGK